MNYTRIGTIVQALGRLVGSWVGVSSPLPLSAWIGDLLLAVERLCQRHDLTPAARAHLAEALRHLLAAVVCLRRMELGISAPETAADVGQNGRRGAGQYAKRATVQGPPVSGS